MFGRDSRPKRDSHGLPPWQIGPAGRLIRRQTVAHVRHLRWGFDPIKGRIPSWNAFPWPVTIERLLMDRA